MANKVFVVNRSSHDFTPAKKFGEIVFLSEGKMSRYQTNNMLREFEELLASSQPTDYIVPCSLNVMNCVACALFAHKHGTLNLLLYKEGEYIERNHIL